MKMLLPEWNKNCNGNFRFSLSCLKIVKKRWCNISTARSLECSSYQNIANDVDRSRSRFCMSEKLQVIVASTAGNALGSSQKSAALWHYVLNAKLLGNSCARADATDNFIPYPYLRKSTDASQS